MRATVFIPGVKPLSKQHSGGRNGNRYFVKSEYTAAKNRLGWEAKRQLMAQGWPIATDEKVWIRISYYGNTDRFDLDNASGFVMDALAGIAYKNDRRARRGSVVMDLPGPDAVKITLRMLPKKMKIKRRKATCEKFSFKP